MSLVKKIILLSALGFVQVIAQIDQTKMVPIGQTVEMACTKANGAYIVWDREINTEGGAIALDGNIQGDRPNFKLDVNGDTQTLSILKLTLEEDDVYRCYTLFKTDYFKINVTTLVAPQDIVIEAPSDPVNEGRTGIFSCIVGPSRPVAEVKWTLVDKNNLKREVFSVATDDSHANGTTTRTSQIQLLIVRDFYQTTLICEATLPALQYQQIETTVVDADLKPESLTITGAERPFKEDEKATISCHATKAKPAATLQWYREGNQVDTQSKTVVNADGTFDVSSTLDLTLSSKDNGIDYRCTATNLVISEANEAPMKVNQTLVVYYVPQITVDTTSITLWEDRNIVLDCSVNANPLPQSTKWLLDGSEVILDQRHVMSNDVTKPSLSIFAANSKDKGHYQCQATNSLGTTTSLQIPVLVLHAPICWDRQVFKYAAEKEQTISITCNVEAAPSGLILFGWNVNGTWLTQEGQRNPDNTFQAYSHYQYTLWSLDDYKTIECKANNGIGEMTSPCKFQVLPPGPAEPPRDCIPTNVTTTSLSLDCVEVFNGGSTPVYRLYHYKGGNNYELVSTQSVPFFYADELNPDTSYYYHICASNEGFPQNVTCSQEFSFKTAYMNKTTKIEPEAVSQADMTPLVITGCILGVFVFIAILLVLLFFCAKQRQKSVSKGKVVEAEEIPQDLEVTSSSFELVNENGQGNKKNVSFSDQEDGGLNNSAYLQGSRCSMGEPIYDRADGLVGVMSQAAIDDLTRQGEVQVFGTLSLHPEAFETPEIEPLERTQSDPCLNRANVDEKPTIHGATSAEVLVEHDETVMEDEESHDRQDGSCHGSPKVTSYKLESVEEEPTIAEQGMGSNGGKESKEEHDSSDSSDSSHESSSDSEDAKSSKYKLENDSSDSNDTSHTSSSDSEDAPVSTPERKDASDSGIKETSSQHAHDTQEKSQKPSLE